MSDFEDELKRSTLDEIEEHLNTLTGLFDGVRSNRPQPQELNEVFRIFHNIKGNSASAGFQELAEATHLFEDYLLQLKNGSREYEERSTQLFFSYLTQVGQLVEYLRRDLFHPIDMSELKNEFLTFLNGNGENTTKAEEVCDGDFLIVDDEPDIVGLLGEELKTEFGMEYGPCVDGMEAFQLASKKEYLFIITDFMMPRLDGLRLVQELRTNPGPNQHTPIIVMTGHRPNLHPDQELWENVFFLDKPISMPKLKFLIKCCLGLKRKSA